MSDGSNLAIAFYIAGPSIAGLEKEKILENEMKFQDMCIVAMRLAVRNCFIVQNANS